MNIDISSPATVYEIRIELDAAEASELAYRLQEKAYDLGSKDPVGQLYNSIRLVARNEDARPKMEHADKLNL